MSKTPWPEPETHPFDDVAPRRALNCGFTDAYSFYSWVTAVTALCYDTPDSTLGIQAISRGIHFGRNAGTS